MSVLRVRGPGTGAQSRFAVFELRFLFLEAALILLPIFLAYAI